MIPAAPNTLQINPEVIITSCHAHHAHHAHITCPGIPKARRRPGLAPPFGLRSEEVCLAKTLRECGSPSCCGCMTRFGTERTFQEACTILQPVCAAAPFPAHSRPHRPGNILPCGGQQHIEAGTWHSKALFQGCLVTRQAEACPENSKQIKKRCKHT